MPFEEITKEKYNELMQHLVKIDLTEIKEGEDKTNHTGESACGGNSCEVKYL
jgi:hypothetical protein